MGDVDLLSAATATFQGVLDRVGVGDLGAATPCEGWDVAELLTHVVVGSEMAMALLDGATKDEAMGFWGQTFGDQVVAKCRTVLDQQLARFATVTDWDRVVHHVPGDMPASQLAQFRIGDTALHAWDLATAVGVEVVIPDDLAAAILGSMEPMREVIGRIGMFGEGPSGTVPDDAPVVQRLLDFTGRRP
jgi:uncharacterized protein (TIGR03086 family)